MLVVVTFDLPDGADYDRVYKALADLNFYPTAKNIRLPSTSVMGVWDTDPQPDAEGLRSIFMVALEQAGAPPESILVAIVDQAAFWGPKVYAPR